MKNSILRYLLVLAVLLVSHQIFAQSKTSLTNQAQQKQHAVVKQPIPKSTVQKSAANKVKPTSLADKLTIYKQELAKLEALPANEKTPVVQQKIAAFKQLIAATTKRQSQLNKATINENQQ